MPTPGLAWLAAERGVPGVMVSASHNPFSDNGIKLLSASGTKLPDSTERAIEGEIGRLVALPAGRRAAGGNPSGGWSATPKASPSTSSISPAP